MNLFFLKISFLFLLLQTTDCQTNAKLKTTDSTTHQVPSEAMHRNIPVSVVVPTQYKNNADVPFSVIYLLHGHSGNYQDYLVDYKELQMLSDKHQVIFVCPDGGYGSWYFDSPIDSNYRYETFISKELVTWVDSQYRTKASAENRSIGGLSMGGHGALYLAIRHPETFGAAGSMSGGLDFRPFAEEWDIKERLGVYAKNKEIWAANCVTNMVDKIPANLRLTIDCGTEDFFLSVNRIFHEKLEKRGIKHRYSEQKGSHDWNYWEKSLPEMIAFLSEKKESANNKK